MANRNTPIEIKTSEKFKLNWLDIAKAGLIAALTPVLVLVQNSLDAGELTFNWKPLAMAAIGGFVAYLVKNFFTPSQIILKGTKVDEAIEANDK